jgi:hypothetical protein
VTDAPLVCGGDHFEINQSINKPNNQTTNHKTTGFCKTPLSLVMEYLPEGDLLHFLRERKKNEVDLSTKMTIALDIARGEPPSPLFSAAQRSKLPF